MTKRYYAAIQRGRKIEAVGAYGSRVRRDDEIGTWYEPAAPGAHRHAVLVIPVQRDTAARELARLLDCPARGLDLGVIGALPLEGYERESEPTDNADELRAEIARLKRPPVAIGP